MTTWVMKVPVISAMHVPEALFQRLTKEWGAGPVTVAPYAGGCYICALPRDGHVPAELSLIFDWARARDADWVRVDADGAVIDGLPVYYWG